MSDELKPDREMPEDATVVQPHTLGVEVEAQKEPPDDATVAALRDAAVGTLHKDQTAANDQPEAFNTRPTVGVPSAPPRLVLRSRAVAIALGAVTGLVMFGLTALWLLHGR